VLFLVTCASVAGCDDYDEIADWGELNLPFLRRYSEYFFGVPGEDWLRALMNRIAPELFEACFMSWALSLRSDAADLIAHTGARIICPSSRRAAPPSSAFLGGAFVGHERSSEPAAGLGAESSLA